MVRRRAPWGAGGLGGWTNQWSSVSVSRCYEPVFEEVLVGCLVRVSIGPNHVGVQTYRVCIVQSVETDLTRPVGGTPPRP